MTLAVTAAGLQIDTVDEAAAAIAGAITASFGNTLQVSNPNTTIAQFVAVGADVTVTVEEGLQGVYSQLTITGATGVALDNLGLLVGLSRNLATQTIGEVEATNASASPVNVPQGAILQDNATLHQYAVVTAATIGASTTGMLVVRALLTGPATIGTGAYSAVSSFAGASSLSFVGDSTTTQGTDQETDADYRLRIMSDGARAGRGTLASILAAVRDVDGVVRAAAYENTTMLTGIASPVAISGLPPKSFVVVVQGGTSANIAAAIYDTMPAGIESYGDTTVNVDTGEGYDTPVSYEVAAPLTVYVSATVSGASIAYADAVKASVIAYTAEYPTTVLYNRVLCAILDSLPMGADVTTLTMGTAPSPVATSNIVVPWNQYPVATTASIVLVFT